MTNWEWLSKLDCHRVQLDGVKDKWTLKLWPTDAYLVAHAWIGPTADDVLFQAREQYKP